MPSSARVSQRKRFDGDRPQGLRLFVDGLDMSMDHTQTRKIFEKFGTVVSVFVPKRMRRARKVKFGFVSFKQRKDGMEAMKAMHGKKLHNTYISVNPARFPDRRISRKLTNAGTKKKTSKQVWRQKDIMKGKGKKGVRQVWRVKARPEMNEPEGTLKDMQMIPEVVSLNKNISRLVLASTREVMCCDDIKQWIEDEGWSDIQVKPFGAKEKILEFTSIEDRQAFMEQMEGKDSLFISLQSLEIAHQPKEYLIWLKIWKVPIGLWSVDFISRIAAKLGSVVCVDDATSKGRRYDVARVLFAAPDPILENQIFPITVGTINTNVLVEIDYIFDESLSVNGKQAHRNVKEDCETCSDEEVASFHSEFSSPIKSSGDGGGSEGSRRVDDSSTKNKSNDERTLDCSVAADSVFEMVRENRSNQLFWSVNINSLLPLNVEIKCWSDSLFNNRLRINIPTEAFNILAFGCSFPICPLEVMCLSPIWFGLDFGQGLLSECFNINSNGAVLGSFEKPLIDNCEFNAEPVDSERLLPESHDFEASHQTLSDEEAILKKAKQGVSRNSKLKSLECLELDCARPGANKQKRGRKPRSIVGPSILREIKEGSGGVDPEIAKLQEAAERRGAGAYFTRATKVWMLGKSAGLKYPGSDAEAIKGLAEELEEDHPILLPSDS